ncbi:MAG TPA: hypothetical protein VFR97_05995 [Capillimicrobium sp.]|nr:hypothetical protein [Capillimicrobium sp.]
MQRWTSEPLDLPVPPAAIARAHLEFQGTRVSGPSFVVYTFVNADGERLPDDADREHPRFAGAFSVFAYGDCWGATGHCDAGRGPVSAFDRRPEHHLTPVTFTLDVTDAVKRLEAPEHVRVTVHAARPVDPDATDVLRFERLALYAYQ